MRWTVLSLESRPEAAPTWPKPGEVTYAIGMTLAVHLALTLAVVMGLRAFGVT
jgi:hypothetical protein